MADRQIDVHQRRLRLQAASRGGAIAVLALCPLPLLFGTVGWLVMLAGGITTAALLLRQWTRPAAADDLDGQLGLPQTLGTFARAGSYEKSLLTPAADQAVNRPLPTVRPAVALPAMAACVVVATLDSASFRATTGRSLLAAASTWLAEFEASALHGSPTSYATPPTSTSSASNADRDASAATKAGGGADEPSASPGAGTGIGSVTNNDLKPPEASESVARPAINNVGESSTGDAGGPGTATDASTSLNSANSSTGRLDTNSTSDSIPADPSQSTSASQADQSIPMQHRELVRRFFAD